MYQQKPEGLYLNKYGRVMEHECYATRIYWNGDMLSFLRRHFSTMLNEEIAGCLGVSPRTMIRKARELGLEKDPEWLRKIWEERRMMAHVISKKKGYPGGFEKGKRSSIETEFKKGHKLTAEQEKKRSESMKRWYLLHPLEAKVKARKAWETRSGNAHG
jgi:hypothetical protein